MRGRRTVFALAGALLALFGAFSVDHGADVATTASRRLVAVAPHVPVVVSHATRRVPPQALAVLAAGAALVLVVGRVVRDAKDRSALLVLPPVLASRGPPRSLLYG